MTAPMAWGKKNSEVQNERGPRELYIVNFKDPKTEISIHEVDSDPNDWIQVAEHFDHKRQMGYPCALFADAAYCIGCAWPVEHPEWTNEWLRDKDANTEGMDKAERAKQDPGWSIRDPQSKWIVRAINSEGYNRVYRIGWKLFSQFKEHFADEEYGALNNRVYQIKKSGSGLQTETTAIPTNKEPFKPKYPAPPESEIWESFGNKYLSAHSKYVELGLIDEANQPTLEAKDNEPRADEAPAKEPEAKADSAPPADEAQSGTTHWVPMEPVELEDGTKWDPNLVAREADSPDMKAWLDNRPEKFGGPIEYPARAPRSVLVGLVEKAQTPNF